MNDNDDGEDYEKPSMDAEMISREPGHAHRILFEGGEAFSAHAKIGIPDAARLHGSRHGQGYAGEIVGPIRNSQKAIVGTPYLELAPAAPTAPSPPTGSCAALTWRVGERERIRAMLGHQ